MLPRYLKKCFLSEKGHKNEDRQLSVNNGNLLPFLEVILPCEVSALPPSPPLDGD